MDYYKTDREIIVNTSENERYIIPVGSYVLTEATGMVTACNETKLQDNITRIEADIVARDIAVAEELARLEAERQAEQPPEEPVP